MKTWKANLEETKKHYIDWWNHKGVVLNMWEHFQKRTFKLLNGFFLVVCVKRVVRVYISRQIYDSSAVILLFYEIRVLNEGNERHVVADRIPIIA